MEANSGSRLAKRIPSHPTVALETASGCPRDFLGNRFVYTVISPRARGLSIGINMNPDKYCNFDCVYCEVNRNQPAREAVLDIRVMSEELDRTLDFVLSGRIRERPSYGLLSDELLQLRHVSLSGDGEPTLCPVFVEAVETLVHIRAMGRFPFFKLVLITNATGLDRPEIQQGLNYLTTQDEVWAKLEAGSQAYMETVNRPQAHLEKVQQNILHLGRQRPVIIQGLFPAIHGQEPPPGEIERYAQRLLELKNGGAKISLVQIYSATRPTTHSECGHLSLRSLSRIAQVVKQTTGLRVEVF